MTLRGLLADAWLTARALHWAYVRRDPRAWTLYRWFRRKGDRTLRLEYPLDADSVVWDVGGYRGDWAAEIASRYDPIIFVFEPVPEYYQLIVRRFRDKPKVRVYQFGLADRDRTARLWLREDASGEFGAGGERISVQLRDVAGFAEEVGLTRAHLMKINIEGAEYDLLERMIQCELVTRCDDLQIQFHDFVPDATVRRERIRAQLSRTHRLTYDYPFVWENWRRIR